MRNITMARKSRKYLTGIFNTLAVIILCLLGSASAQKNNIVSTNQVNPPPPGVIPPQHSYDAGLTWAADVCGNGQPLPHGSELEWRPVLDPNQDAEAEGHLVAVSGTIVYDPDPGETGYCQGRNGTILPAQPLSCSSDSDCNSCNGT